MMVCLPTSLSQEVGAAPGSSRRGTGSRGNRGGRLPERQARDGGALQQGFAGATVKPWRGSRGRAPPRPRRAHRPMGGDHATPVTRQRRAPGGGPVYSAAEAHVERLVPGRERVIS